MSDFETIRAQLTGHHAPKPDRGVIPRGGNLVGDIGAIARSWFGSPKGGAEEAAPAVGPIPTPEALAAAAEERGLRVRYASRSLGSLSDSDFPCVILEKGGASRLIVRRLGEGLECSTNGVRYTIKEVELAAAHSGTVFFVTPRAPIPDRAAAPGEPTGEGEHEAQGGHQRVLPAALGIMAKRYPGTLAQLFLAALIGNALLLALPIFSMSVYDRVVPHLAFETLWALVLGVTIALLADLAVRSVRLRLTDAITVGTALDLQARFFRRLTRAKLDHLPRHGSTLAAGVRDIEAICGAIPALFVAITVDIPFLALATGLLFALGGTVALVPVGAGVMMLVLYGASHMAGEGASRRAARLAREQSGLLHETVDALENVKTVTAEDAMLRRWERLADEAAAEGHEGKHWTAFAAHGAGTVGQIAIVLGMMASVYEISMGAMTIGAMSACSMLIGRVMTPVGQAVGLLHKAWHLSHTLDAIDRVLSAPQEAAGDPTRAEGEVPHGEIVLRNVSFAYPGAPDPTLSQVSLTIRPGEKVAIIGRVGSGKTTLLRLLMRLSEPTSGAILIDGCDIRQVSPRALRRRFGYMRQDPVLIDDTLGANLALGLDEPQEDDLSRSARLAGVHDFAARHPNGYGLRVGPRGDKLSGGERQSVALARALSGNPRALVLDEPTASMDNALEARVVKDLSGFCEGRTLILATHRAPMLALVDRIIWMEGGKVAADGSKEEVLRLLGQAA